MALARRVLVIEDDPDIRISVVEFLAIAGLSADGCASADEGLAYLQAHDDVGLILMDWMMPGMLPREFRRQQQSTPALSEIPLVIFSAASNIHTLAAEVSPAAVLRKPVTGEQLLSVVERYLF